MLAHVSQHEVLVDVDRAVRFGRMIVTEAQRLRIKLQSPEIMSAWFAGEGHRAERLRVEFQNLSRQLDIKQLHSFLEKNYGPNERDEYLSYRVMDFLRPVLTASAVVHFAREESSGPEPNSVIILVGEDEYGQWDRIRAIYGADVRFGMVFNGILKTQDGYVFRQHDTGPLWGDEEACVREAAQGNQLRWLAQHFLAIVRYPMTPTIDGRPLSLSEWQENIADPPNGITAGSLISAVWEKIRPVP